MAKILYREISNRYGSSRSSYTGCSITACKGEQVQNFGRCIVHLEDAQASAYEASLREGTGVLNFSSGEVDADFINTWVSRIATNNGIAKHIPVPIAMQHTKMVDALVFHRYDFARGIMLQGLRADAVRIGESEIAGGLDLTAAEVNDEVSLQQLGLDKLTLVGMQAKILWLLSCSIKDNVDARSLTLERGLHLRGSTVGESAQFDDSILGQPESNVTISAQFHSTASFTSCTFPSETQIGRYADLPPSIFSGSTAFDGSTFGGEDFGAVSFKECEFRASASFKRVRAHGGVSFDAASFQARTDLSDFEVHAAPYSRGDVSLFPARAFDFTNVVLNADIDLGASVEGDARVQDVVFRSTAEGLQLSATGTLEVKRVSIEHFSVLRLSSRTALELNQVQIQSGGRIRVNSPEINLRNFACARPVVVSAAVNEARKRPKLLSLVGSDCQGLTLAGMDYSDTRFLGTTNLDKLMISGQFILGMTSGLRSRRSILGEESLLRSRDNGRSREDNEPEQDNNALGRSPTARELASAYRALRKGREDQKDEAGSIDFYYGEMEMRRIASGRLSVERLILTAYWLVAGYGLRAWRALVLLLGSLVASTLFLTRVPLRQNNPIHPTFGDALLFAGQSGLSLSGPSSQYSTPAQVVQITLRVIVPILIALAILSLRTRVKR